MQIVGRYAQFPQHTATALKSERGGIRVSERRSGANRIGDIEL